MQTFFLKEAETEIDAIQTILTMKIVIMIMMEVGSKEVVLILMTMRMEQMNRLGMYIDMEQATKEIQIKAATMT